MDLNVPNMNVWTQAYIAKNALLRRKTWLHSNLSLVGRPSLQAFHKNFLIFGATFNFQIQRKLTTSGGEGSSPWPRRAPDLTE